MKKKQYEKPAVEKISFSVEDVLMIEGGGTIPTEPSPSGTPGIGTDEPYSFDGGYKLH